MIPQDRLSTVTIVAAFRNELPYGNPLQAYEMGGVGLSDPSQGIELKPWLLRYDVASGDFLVGADDVPETVLFNRPDVTQISLAFDRNMSPVVSFTQAGQAKFWFFEDLIPAFVFWETELGTAVDPHVCHDDKRFYSDGISDVILSYVRDNNLYYRQQRDRYLVERQLYSGVSGLGYVGMNKALRLQWMCVAVES